MCPACWLHLAKLGTYQDRARVEQFDRFPCGARTDVRVVANHPRAHVAYEGLNDANRDAKFHHVSDERMAKIVEPQPREAGLLRQAVPSGVPILVMLVRITAALTFVLAVSNEGNAASASGNARVQ